MRRIRPIFIFLFLIVLIVIVLGSDIYFSKDEVEESNVVLITKMRNGDYWKTVLKGAEAAAEELNVNLIYDAPLEENDIEGQINLVRSYLRDDIHSIVLAASDFESLVPVLEEAETKGIRVVLIDSQVNTDQYYKSFSTDNYLAGVQAGDEVVRLLDGEGTVGVVSFVKGSENAMAREKGLNDVLFQYPNIEIVDTKYCMSSPELAETHAMIYLDHEVDLIIGLNAIATIGVGRAIKHYGEAIGVGFDATSESIKHLDRGDLDAIVVQNPYGMGYLGVKHASRDLKDETDKNHAIETFLITTENMFEKENQKIVFPFDVN